MLVLAEKDHRSEGSDFDSGRVPREREGSEHPLHGPLSIDWVFVRPKATECCDYASEGAANHHRKSAIVGKQRSMENNS